MSKVLVDPAALEEAAKWLEVHSSSSGSAEAFAAEALREAIAQPAEAGRPGDWEWLKLMAEVAEQDRPWNPRLGMTDVEMAYAQSASPSKVLELIAALSAVTAERDRLRKDAERYRWASSGVHEAETLVSIVNCHGGYAEKVAERVDVYREAAMAAKEPEPEHVCSGCGAKGWTGNCLECIPY